jgi:hypothetical protein
MFYVFSSTKSENKRAEQVLPGRGGKGEMAQIMYTHVSQCKNYKIKFKNIKKGDESRSHYIRCKKLAIKKKRSFHKLIIKGQILHDCPSYVTHKRVKLSKEDHIMTIAIGWEMEERLSCSKGKCFSYMRSIASRGLLYNLVPAVENSILCISKVLRVLISC